MVDDPDSLSERGARLGVILEYFTIAWNTGEAFLTIGFGIASSSLALIGFGTDSIVEIFASAVVIWHLRSRTGRSSPIRTRRALRLVAAAFLFLGVVLTAAATRDLITGRQADESIFGIVYLAVTAVVMFGLAHIKHRVARETGSAPLRAEATMTFLDGVLSVATLTGLACHAVFGWWWADPSAALVVALFSLNEARDNWHEASELH